MCPAAGAYTQWKARAIGEKSSAAEAKLAKAGPYEGMTVRRAMTTVLRVLKDVLGDDFSIDRLEMVCVDNLLCQDDDEEFAGTIQSGGRLHDERDILRSVDENALTMSSQDGSRSIGSGRSSSSGSAAASDREVSGRKEGVGGTFRAKNGSPWAPSIPRRLGVFRRISTSEMKDLLAEEPAAS